MTDKLAALEQGRSYDFVMNKEPKCPHCGSDFDIQQGEAWFLYDENNTHDVECKSCNMEFQVSSHAHWSFSTEDQED